MSFDDFKKHFDEKGIGYNGHHLARYYKMCMWYFHANYNKNHGECVLERHHLLPKANDMFPEYSSFAKNRWNLVKVPKRAHVILHFILYKATHVKSQVYAYNQMRNRNPSTHITQKQKENFDAALAKVLATDMQTKKMGRKNKWVKNCSSGSFYKIPIHQVLADDEIKMMPPREKKPEHVKKYHDPVTHAEYWVDVRFPIPSNLVLGRSAKFKKRVQQTSTGNKSSKGLKKFYDENDKAYSLHETDPKIAELNLKRGVPESLRTQLSLTRKKNKLSVGENNGMYGRTRSDKWNMFIISDISGVILQTEMSTQSFLQTSKRQMWNKGVLTEDVLRKMFPKAYMKYVDWYGFSIEVVRK